jgi:hypothetical protein
MFAKIFGVTTSSPEKKSRSISGGADVSCSLTWGAIHIGNLLQKPMNSNLFVWLVAGVNLL